MIGFFPLNLIAFPYELLSLHIFEPRYKQLIEHLEESGENFGIPTFMNDCIKEYGTEMQLAEVVNRYSDGRMDIKVKGLRTFKVKTFINPLKKKLYAGGEVEFMEPKEDSTLSDRILLIEQLRKLYSILNVQIEMSAEEPFLTFKVGHKVGMSQQQEYQLRTYILESDRIQFMIDHLNRSIPILREAEATKERIKMNGHFRNYDPLDF